MKVQHLRSVGLVALSYSLALLSGIFMGSTAQTTDCMEDYLGDGDCDNINNNDDCDYDGGDCCEESCVDAKFVCVENGGFDCLDPDYPIEEPEAFSYAFMCDELRMGNAYCDSVNNNEHCGYDGGDCCSCTCTPTVTGIGCGDTPGEYTCLDPAAACSDGNIEAGTLTTVTVSANGYDNRPGGASGGPGCLSGGCKANLARDGDVEDKESRWSCRQSLVSSGELCEITFSFEEAVNIEYVQVAFFKANQRSRTVQVTSNGEDMGTFDSSSASDFTAFGLHDDDVETLTLTTSGLYADEWISFLEVRFMVEGQHT